MDAQLTDRKITAVRQATAEDKTLQKVQQLIKEGWPSDKRGLPNQVVPYFHLRDELVYEDGIIFKGDRCVIPQPMRSTLEELHRPQLGVEATLRRARETVFWPRLSSELRDYVSQCDTCRSFDPEQQKEPLINHDIVTQVWAKVGVDLFTFENRDYMVTVDYLTNFWEVDHLRDDTSAHSVIRKLKLNFASMEFLKSWSVTMAHSLLLRSSRLLQTSGKSSMTWHTLTTHRPTVKLKVQSRWPKRSWKRLATPSQISTWCCSSQEHSDTGLGHNSCPANAL